MKKHHVQLASAIELGELRQWKKEQWQRYQLEPKLDGLRMFVYDGVPYSRNGKALSFNLQPIVDELYTIKNIGQYVIDGELYGGGWERSMSVGRSTMTIVSLRGTRYYVFDMIPKKDWENGKCTLPQNYRRQLIREYIGNDHIDWKQQYRYLGLSQLFYVDTFGAFARTLNECIDYLHYEGVMLKDMDAQYEWKRTKSWLKYKPLQTDDCLVIGMNEGRGKYRGMLGSFIVAPPAACVDEYNTHAATNVSGHLTDEMRRDIWHNRKQLIGKAIIEVEYRRRSSNQKLVEARFVRFRHDKRKN